MPVPLTTLAAALGVALATAGCGDGSGRQRMAILPGGGDRPDEPPAVVNGELPFRYPPALYARKVQGNVTLRVFVDRDGRTVADSTRVEESSGFEAMDSAAVRGSQELRFVPARRRGEPVGVAVLFPVYFRHPEVAPLPGDSVLSTRVAAGRGDTVAQSPDTTRRKP